MTEPGVEWLLLGSGPATSRDLTSWTAASTIPGDSTCAAWNGQTWALGTGNNGMYVSADGTTWTHTPSDLDDGFVREVVWTGTRFIAIGQWPAGIVATSTDGLHWITVATPIDSLDNVLLAAIDGEDNEWVAVGEDDAGVFDPLDATIIHTTDGGATWTQATIPSLGRQTATDGFEEVAGKPGAWIATTNDPHLTGGPSAESIAQIMQSPDGLNWDLVQVATEIHSISTVGRLDDLYVVAGHDRIAGNNVTLISTDGGPTWGSKHSAPVFEPFPLFHPNGVMFGFSFGDVYSSTDGLTWTFRYATPGDGPEYVAWGGSDVLPPQRQFPRDDGLGISTRRSWPPNISQQHGLRRGTVNTYQ